MQVISSRDAQLQFGSFSREAQKEPVIVTSHGNPVFMAIPIKMTADVVQLIQTVNPCPSEQTAQHLTQFFQRLAQTRLNEPEMTEAELTAFIQDAN